MKQNPVILISGSTQKRGIELGDLSVSLALDYSRAIQTAGGMPWLLPCLPGRDFVAEAVRRSDGVLLTGGDDVQPALYHREKLPAVLAETVHPEAPERDLFELLLVAEVFRQRKPLLAICRGLQILNVALGGSLIVDIGRQAPKALNHRRLDQKYEVVHEVKLEIGSEFAQMISTDRLGVNSTHHQAVGKIAKPLRATCRCIDGIIEGLEWDSAAGQILPYLQGVQFHPERLFSRHAEHLEIFKRFINAACRRRKPQRKYEA